MTTIARGNTGRLHVTFAPVSGTVALADVLCTITAPSLSTTVLTIAADGTNKFYADVAVDDVAELGTWHVRWDSNPPSELITVPGSYIVAAFPPALTATRRTQIGTTVQRIRRQLDASVRQEYNRLGSAMLAADTVLTVDFDIQPSLRAGALLSIEDELLKVVSINTASHEVTVIRGFQDTVAVDHADALEILVSPRFTLRDIHELIVQEIESWSPRLFRVVTYQWPAIADTDQTIEVPGAYSDAIGVISLRRQWSEDSDSNAWPQLDFRLMRGASGTWTGATSSGLVIRMLHNQGVLRSGLVVAQLAVPFDVSSGELADTDDFVDDFGLEYSMLEVIELGVKMRLMGDQEIGRSARGQQDEPRRAEEVPSGSALTVAQTIRQNYMRRFGDEVRKLQTKYPMRAW